jgi:subtilisin
MNHSRKYGAFNKLLQSATLVLLVSALVGCSDSKMAPTGPQKELADIQLEQLAKTGQPVPDHYIVVFKDEVDDPAAAANEIARARGLGLRHTYQTALKGFAAVIPPARLDAVRTDPRIRYIAPDYVLQINQQIVPTGVGRIEADLNPSASDPVDVDIAIIDTGIDLDHPDLNVVSHVSFAGGDGDDKHGHGTHVAGIAAARDNGIGVVGVAPGARLHAVKVLKPNGSGSTSDIVAGIDYVAQNADVIDVANMSLGGSGSDDGNCGNTNEDPMHTAICSAVNAGVVFVVSAGNASRDTKYSRPGSYDEVITVSAMADFDGQAGGYASPTCENDEDDSFAYFSNYGADVDLMAPGVCILSTWNDGGTNTISGTSMASPHVAGVVGLYIAANGRDTNGDGVYNKADVDNIKAALVASGIPQRDGCGLYTYDDSDGIEEPIVFANALNVGGGGNCGVAPPPAPVTDIALTELTAPLTVVRGDMANVDVTVKNVGNQDVTVDINVTLADNTDGVTIGVQTISAGLAAGGSTTLTYSWDTGAASLGDHSLTASHDFTDENNTNDSQSTTVTIFQPSGGVEVVSMDPDTLHRDETVRATIGGSGFVDGADVTLENGSGPKPAAGHEVVVDANTISFIISSYGGPARVSVWDVRVTNPDGSSGVLVGGFTRIP